jgi:hypothetical protein
LVILPLGPEHRTGFALFHCAHYGEWWTKQIQEMIQTRLADSIEAGEVNAIGAWDDGDLVALAAYTAGRQGWHISVAATRVGHQRHEHATNLARHIIGVARGEGALVVTWFMHEDNEPMFRLAKTLHGSVVRDPDDGSRRYFICTIKLD